MSKTFVSPHLFLIAAVLILSSCDDAAENQVKKTERPELCTESTTVKMGPYKFEISPKSGILIDVISTTQMKTIRAKYACHHEYEISATRLTLGREIFDVDSFKNPAMIKSLRVSYVAPDKLEDTIKRTGARSIEYFDSIFQDHGNHVKRKLSSNLTEFTWGDKIRQLKIESQVIPNYDGPAIFAQCSYDECYIYYINSENLTVAFYTKDDWTKLSDTLVRAQSAINSIKVKQ